MEFVILVTSLITILIVFELYKFKNDNIVEDLWWGDVSESEHDIRDYKLSDIKWIVKTWWEVPKEYDLLKYLNNSYNQWKNWSCTAFSLSHINHILQVIDYNNKDIMVNPCHLRRNMWHHCDWDDKWDTLTNALYRLKKHWQEWWIEENWWRTQKLFKISWYAFEKLESSDKGISKIKELISNNNPLYFAFRWTSKVYSEMTQWELKTTITTEEATWWHAVAMVWYDEEYLYFVNSWRHNDGEMYEGDMSIFKMSIKNFNKAIDKWMLFWRYFIVYDIKDNVLFPDFTPKPNTEAYEAVKWVKDNDIINWIKWDDWQYYLKPNEPLTRLQLALILYRYSNKK